MHTCDELDTICLQQVSASGATDADGTDSVIIAVAPGHNPDAYIRLRDAEDGPSRIGGMKWHHCQGHNVTWLYVEAPSSTFTLAFHSDGAREVVKAIMHTGRLNIAAAEHAPTSEGAWSAPHMELVMPGHEMWKYAYTTWPMPICPN